LYQADLAKWLIRILEHGKSGDAYNVGSDEPITIVDLARTVRDIISPEKVVKVLGGLNFARDRDIYLPNISKAREDLGLNVDFDLRRAIDLTANQIRSCGFK
jgi:dTDP-glucose 4,6-dehydratase